jgi:hypothetical protein
MSATARQFEQTAAPDQLVVEAPEDAVRPGLEACGLAVDDTHTALGVMAAGASIAELHARMARGEILSKRTVHGRARFLLAVRRRYCPPAAALPPPAALARFLDRLEAPVARAQMLLPYVLLADRLAWELAGALVVPRSAGDLLLKREVVDALGAALERHGRKPWGDAMQRRWAEGFLSVLRESGLLGRNAQRERVLIYSVRAEVFSFHLLGLYLHGLRGRALRESSYWRSLLLKPAEVARAIRIVADRGWWRINSIGAVEEYLPVSEAAADWGGDVLGSIPI